MNHIPERTRTVYFQSCISEILEDYEDGLEFEEIYRIGVTKKFWILHNRFEDALFEFLIKMVEHKEPLVICTSSGLYVLSEEAKSFVSIQKLKEQEEIIKPRQTRQMKQKREETETIGSKKVKKDLIDVGFVPIYKPTEEEFKDFNQYILKIYPEASKYGGCRIQPPKSYKPHSKLPDEGYSTREEYDKLYHFEDRKIPVHFQKVTGNNGLYTIIPEKLKENITVNEYIKRFDNINTPKEDHESVFWDRIRIDLLNYSYDIEDTLFEEGVLWNLNELKTFLNLIPNPMQGVKSSFVYFGSFPSLFPWHCEDFNFFSVSYLHFGESKHWYMVSSSEKKKFDKLLKDLFIDEHTDCIDFIKHKTTMIHPEILMENGIKIFKSVQLPGEFMVTFPASYHSGFNYGINCAEAVNFALEPWLEWAKEGKLKCDCPSKRINWDLNLNEFKKAIKLNKISDKILEFDQEEEEKELEVII